MYTEAERVQIRRWLGYPAVYTTSFSGLELAITKSQAVADGGVRADDSTELAVRGYLTQLSAIETRIQNLYAIAEASKDDEIVVDPVRALAAVRQIGRQYVGHISDALDTKVLRDVFGAANADPQGGAWARGGAF